MYRLIAKIFMLCSAVLLLSPVFSQDITKDFPKSFSLKINNPLNSAQKDVMIVVSSDQIKKACKDFNPNAFIVTVNGIEIPSQYNQHDHDHPGIVTLLDKVEKMQEVIIRYNPTGSLKHDYVKRTQAELSHKTGGKFVNRAYEGGEFHNVDYLRVPPEHKDHSWFIRYEGPGWESDKVGYRFYLDQRDANDVFGKRTHEMVLQNVGRDGFDSYHEPQSWGMDVMKVGKSLGLGTPGLFVDGNAIRIDKTDSVDCRITENGVVYSSILTNYYGWKVKGKKMNVQSRLNIHAGTRLTHQEITVSENPERLCTGIVKDDAAKLMIQKGDASHWGYIATYGKQSLNKDKDELGLAVFFKPGDWLEFTQDEFSHVVILKPSNGNLDYYFMAAWVLEPEGIKDEKQFSVYLEQTALALATPIKIELVKNK